MPGLDLSSLNAQELRNVLEAAQARNQQSLTEDVLSEIAARGTRPPGRRPWRAQEREPDIEERPGAWWDDLRQEAEQVEEPSNSKAPALLGIAAAVLVAAGLGWWLSPRGHLQPTATAVSETTIPAPPRVMQAYTAPTPRAEQPPERAAPPPAVAPPVSAPPATAVQAQPEKPVRLAKAETTERTPVRSSRPATTKPPASGINSKACRGQPTPADRTVCGYASLTAQHRQMRAAYDRALSAGVDPLVVDRDQAEWRIRRNGVSNPDTLAKLYTRRIRELNAAATRAEAEPPT